MNKELIIRNLKENKKLIALGFVILMSAIIIGVSISTLSKTDNTALYQKSKRGIFIEDRFLEHGEVVDYGGTIGKVAEKGDGFSFNVYGKVGDWIHYHHKNRDSSFRTSGSIKNCVSEENACYPRGFLVGSNYERSFELFWEGIYTISVHNYDMDYSGYIDVFVIVYDEYYPPDCPLC